MAFVIGLIIAAGLGFIPASIAKKKGYSFGLWWFYGWMLFIVAIIHVALIEDKNAKPVAYVPVGGAYAPAQSGNTAASHAANYTRLFSLPEKLYQTGAPVCIEEGALLKDEQSGCVFSQLKLLSITDKTIRAVKASVSLMDAFGKPMNISSEHQYLDLCVTRGCMFGAETTVMLPDAHARAFCAAVTAVMFDDGTLWEPSDTAWEPLPEAVTLDEVYPDAELRNQFKLEFGMKSRYAYTAFADLCYCPCGALNRQSEGVCHACGCDLTALRALDTAELESRKNERLEQERIAEEERQEQERIAEEKRQEQLRLEREEALANAVQAKKVALITAPIVCVGIAFLIVLNSVIIPNSRYNKAVELMEAGEITEAALLFGQLGDCKDARKLSTSLWDQITGRKQAIAAGLNHTVGLKSDGKVSAVGDNEYGQCDVSDWKKIVAVAAGGWHTVGLKSDASVVAVGVVAVGYNDSGRCEVSEWTDIVAVAAGDYHTVGLKSDGTVVAVGSNYYGQCDVSRWNNIVAIAAGKKHTVGLKSDGTVVATGGNDDGQCNVSGWSNIVAIAAGDYYTVGLQSDGTVVATGDNEYGQCDVGDWTDIVAVAAGGYHTVGLQSDGTVVAVGENDDGQCDVGDWTDIVAVAAGGYHTVGLQSDGTVVAVGYNDSDQCDVDGWTDIKLPE